MRGEWKGKTVKRGGGKEGRFCKGRSRDGGYERNVRGKEFRNRNEGRERERESEGKRQSRKEYKMNSMCEVMKKMTKRN